jgi:hypothetical protein
MFESERYNELVSSAFESAYDDELEKLGVGFLARSAAAAAPQLLRGLRGAGGAAKSIGGAASRTAARQQYALGLGSRGKSLAELGIPGAKPMSRVQRAVEAQKQLGSFWTSPIKRTKQLIRGHGATSAEKIEQMEKIRAQQEAAQKMFQLTKGTIPGTAKALVTHPVQTIGAGYKTMSPSEKVLFGGFGAMTAHDIATMKDLPPEEKAERLARAGVGTALWPASGGLTMLPQIGMWMGGEEAAGRVAKAIAPKTSKKPAQPQHQLTPEEITAIREGV